jgi:nitrite reductase/ring-hydroxylating ferredoxin subunit
VRSQDAVFGYVNKCPHQPVPLDWDGNPIVDASAQHLQCGKHGARFELSSGRCFHGPCTGEKLQAVELRVDAGLVYVQNVELVAAPGEPS